MTIEQETFSNYTILKDKLPSYGFRQRGDMLVYERPLPKENMRIIIEYGDEICGKIIDLDDGGEYTNFRISNVTGFGAEVKQQFTELLLDIREKCCRNKYFKFEQAQRINEYIFDTYGGSPDFLWPSIPSYGAYRLKSSKKWYAIIGSVPLYKLESSTDSRKEVEVINVKADSGNIERMLAQKGYYPAFHMNKKCWVSIILDDTLADTEIQSLIDNSYKSV